MPARSLRTKKSPGEFSFRGACEMKGFESGSTFSSGRPFVLSASESEDRVEDRREEDQPESEADPFAKALREVHRHDEANHDIDEGDEHEDDPPDGTTDNLKENNDIVDRDDGSPARLSGLGEDFPHRDQKDNDEDEIDERANECSCSLSGTGLVGFSLGKNGMVHSGYI